MLVLSSKKDITLKLQFLAVSFQRSVIKAFNAAVDDFLSKEEEKLIGKTFALVMIIKRLGQEGHFEG